MHASLVWGMPLGENQGDKGDNGDVWRRPPHVRDRGWCISVVAAESPSWPLFSFFVQMDHDGPKDEDGEGLLLDMTLWAEWIGAPRSTLISVRTDVYVPDGAAGGRRCSGRGV